MAEVVIRVEKLSKKYVICHQAEGGYSTLRDQIMKGAKSLGRLMTLGKENDRSTREEFWALKDVSFEVKKGDRFGIIGLNGAGKSTLFKILSRITEPTTGEITIHGSVASLLEVGTGFHPELTGRENIYLNGAILGMSKIEIKKHFNEIVSFAEMDKFLDTPVKRYSSGMYVRLAFAVAAHLEPEILIVDEVLAVGDVGFQKKCLRRMDDVAKGGRTVLFVSHNMAAVQNLCTRVLCLNNGQIITQGDPREVLAKYLREPFSPQTEKVWSNMRMAPGNDSVRLRRACVRPANGNHSVPITVHTPFTIEFDYWNLQSYCNLDLSFQLYNEEGIVVFDVGRVNKPAVQDNNLCQGFFRDVCHIPGDLLNDGRYRIELCVSKDERPVYRMPNVLLFFVQDSGESRGHWYGKWPGAIRPKLEWSTEFIGTS